MVGIGGAFLGPGDGDRKVRSVMEALLPLRWTAEPLKGCRKLPCGLPTDDCEPRLTMRLVWILDSGSGEVV